MQKETWSNVYVNGKKEGIHKEFHENGSVDIQKNYVNNRLHGKLSSYSSYNVLLDYFFYKIRRTFGQQKCVYGEMQNHPNFFGTQRDWKQYLSNKTRPDNLN